MGNSLFSIGISGMQAAQLGMLTTEHNISNANTPGFHQQQIVQATATAQYSGAGFIGQGAQVENITRSYNEFLDHQVLQADTQNSYLQTYSAQIGQINNMLADPTAGVSSALQDFFTAVNGVATAPTSVPARQAMISSGQSLVSRFHLMDQQLGDIRNGVNSQITSTVGLINSYSQQLAQLNQKIADASAGSNGQRLPNDLLDQRDNLIAQLNQQVNVTVLKQDNGVENIFIGKGQPLVLGNQAYTLQATPSSADPSTLEVAYSSGNGSMLISPGSLQGGSLGGLLAFRTEALDPTQNALGRVAVGIAATFNAQQKLGMDLNNQFGTDFFSGVNSQTTPTTIPNTLNTGTATTAATIADVSKLTASDYTLTYSGGSWNLTNNTTSQTVAMTGAGTAANPFVADGLSIVIGGGAPASGDSFLIEPTRDASADIGVVLSDTAKIAAASPISTGTGTANTGSGQIDAGVVLDTTSAGSGAAAFAQPSGGALTPPLLIRFTSPTTYDILDNTNPAAPVPLVPAAIGQSYNPATGTVVSYPVGAANPAYQVTITGQPQANDTFTVDYNTTGVSDNRNALALAGMQSKLTLVNGTASYEGAYSTLVSQIGNQTRGIQVNAQAQAVVLQQSQTAQQSVSGVNLDEEASNLIRYQQAYQAAGKMIQVASTLFDTLLNIK